MRVNKRNMNNEGRTYSGIPEPDRMYIRRHEDGLYLSSAVRDIVAPRGFCFVDVENYCLILTPTDDPAGYKVHRQGPGLRTARLTWCAARKAIHIPEHKRIYGESVDNGTIVFEIKEE